MKRESAVPSAGGCGCALGGEGGGGGAAAPSCGGAFRFGAWGATEAPGRASRAAAATVVAAAADTTPHDGPLWPPERPAGRPVSAGRLQQAAAAPAAPPGSGAVAAAADRDEPAAAAAAGAVLHLLPEGPADRFAPARRRRQHQAESDGDESETNQGDNADKRERTS